MPNRMLPSQRILNYGRRVNGTPKDVGFLGELRRPDGGVSSELSMGVNIDGKERLIPSLVPSLSKEEIDRLLGNGGFTPEIVQKAVDHARRRMAVGISPFYSSDEESAY